MKTLGNIIWIIFGGFLYALTCYLSGAILCLTIIFIPFGIKYFKLGNLMLAPFGKEVDITFDEHPILNVIWMVLVGWELFLTSITMGLLLCLTIVGIPFGKQWFKIAKYSLFPFGADMD